MNRLLIASICMLSLLNCKQDKISPVGLECYSGFEGLSRDENVTDAPVVVQLSGGTAIGSQLVATNGVAWGGCNLPKQFMQDSLAIYVTGYFVTSEALERMNITPLPFVVTSAKLR
ncbi:hypothetical protein [Dyadobacter sp. 676]|uniref:Uncharacterized protein n=1 Tax=Dyadobacter sp. 676 TaxID=3088362 RepID=A0AAU8FT40_9BACT